MLMSKLDVLDLLRCPITKEKIKQIGSSELSVTNHNNIRYPIINGFPILIDFDQSLLSKQDVIQTLTKSTITRKSYRGFMKFLQNMVSGPKKITALNVEHIFQLLKNNAASKILIIGGGTIGQGMNKFYAGPDMKVISFDVYASESVQFVADAHQIPLPSNHFDCVIIQAVLEHVLNPKQVVSEIHRVLKPQGIVYSEIPFLQHVHEGAYDFTRYTESGHRYLFRNFDLIDSGASAGPGTQLLWSIDYFFRSLFRSRLAGKVCKLLFFWLQYFDNIIPETYSCDAASGVFFLGYKASSSIAIHEIIAHYKGAQ